MRSRRPIVAIDGPAGSGKSTVGRRVAEELGFVYVDTGLMYRAVGWVALRFQAAPETEDEIGRWFRELGISFEASEGKFRVLSFGREINEELRQPEVGLYASRYAAYPAVRRFLWRMQRKLGEKGGIVLDGRDIGTVVFPEAEYKFFLDASPEERAKRRYLELQARGQKVSLEEVLQEIRIRDQHDSQRVLAPLQRAEDAVVINTTGLEIEEAVRAILGVIRSSG